MMIIIVMIMKTIMMAIIMKIKGNTYLCWYSLIGRVGPDPWPPASLLRRSRDLFFKMSKISEVG